MRIYVSECQGRTGHIGRACLQKAALACRSFVRTSEFLCRSGACGADDTAAVANTAHSCRVGVVYLQPESLECGRISNAIAHHTTEVGIVYNGGGLSMEVEHVLLSDNRVGLAVMPGVRRAIDTGNVIIRRSAAIGFSNNGGACQASAVS